MRLLLPTLACLATSACSARAGQQDAGPSDSGIQVVVLDGGVRHAALPPAKHLASCSDMTCGNGLEPPLGGDHCPMWLPCRAYTEAQPRCQYLHNLEHGHAVLAWNCPQGCPDLVARLTQEFNDRQADPSLRRILVTPDPQLSKRMAVMVWGWAWAGDDFDEAAVREVLSHQDLEAPEAGLGCDK